MTEWGSKLRFSVTEERKKERKTDGKKGSVGACLLGEGEKRLSGVRVWEVHVGRALQVWVGRILGGEFFFFYFFFLFFFGQCTRVLGLGFVVSTVGQVR